MLVAGSIYEACKYWEIFMSMGFTKCAIRLHTSRLRKASEPHHRPFAESEEEYKKKIYERMLGEENSPSLKSVSKSNSRMSRRR